MTTMSQLSYLFIYLVTVPQSHILFSNTGDTKTMTTMSQFSYLFVYLVTAPQSHILFCNTGDTKTMTTMSQLSYLFIYLATAPLIGCQLMDTCYDDISEKILSESSEGWVRMNQVTTADMCIKTFR